MTFGLRFGYKNTHTHTHTHTSPMGYFNLLVNTKNWIQIMSENQINKTE